MYHIFCLSVFSLVMFFLAFVCWFLIPFVAQVYLENFRKLAEATFRRIALLLDPKYVGHPITDDTPLQLYRA